MSTLDAEGLANLAPFSFFGGVTAHPPTVMVSIGRRDGRPKDTAANILATGEGVVHICHRPLGQAMGATAASLAPCEDEFDLAGLAKTPSTVVAPPRVDGAAVALEAKVQRHLEIGNGPNDVFLLEELVTLRLERLRGGLGSPWGPRFGGSRIREDRASGAEVAGSPWVVSTPLSPPRAPPE